jgi:hypothetical protein
LSKNLLFLLRLLLFLLHFAAGVYWIYESSQLYYGYHVAHYRYFFMVPDWLLFFNAACGLFWIIAGFLLLFSKMKLWPLTGTTIATFLLSIFLTWYSIL